MAVNVNDMFYAYSGNEAIKEKGEYHMFETIVLKTSNTKMQSGKFTG